MLSRLGPIEICCDAPPYEVVQACRRVGVRSPEDVRWLRMSEFRTRQDRSQRGPSMRFWKMFWKKSEHAAGTCTCGQPLPALRPVVVTFKPGEKAYVVLGQCSSCHSIFWD